MLTCEECGKSYPEKGLATHKWRAHGAGKSHVPVPKGARPAWNKGLTKAEDARLAAQGLKTSETFRRQVAQGSFKISRRGPEARAALSKRMSEMNPGGRCRWFRVSGQSVQGTWERDLAEAMDKLGVVWTKRVSEGNRSWMYSDSGRIRRYTPDFYLPDLQLQLEVKGYWWGDDKRKMRLVLDQNPGSGIIVIENEKFHNLLNAADEVVFRGILAP